MKTVRQAPDPLLTACSAMLREVGAFPITSERLVAARPLIEEMVAAIRQLDELDVTDIEPATVFRVQR